MPNHSALRDDSAPAGTPVFPGSASASSREPQAIPLHPRVIVLINGKGGVGKTSVTCNIGGLMASDGLRVLIIDLDPQGGVALELGMRDRAPDDPLATDFGSELYEATRKGIRPTPRKGVRSFSNGGRLDVIPGGEELDVLANSLITWQGQGDDRLTKAISRAAWGPVDDGEENGTGYDVILIDSPPGQPVIQEAALKSARWAIIPAKTDAGSRDGLAKIGARFDAALQSNPELGLLGVLLFDVNAGARTTIKESRTELAEDLAGDRANFSADEDYEAAFEGAKAILFDQTIRSVQTAARKARSNGLLVHELLALATDGHRDLAVKSTAGLSDDYAKLAREVVDRLVERETAQ